MNPAIVHRLCFEALKAQALANLEPDRWYYVEGVRYCSHCRTRRCRRQRGGSLLCVPERFRWFS